MYKNVSLFGVCFILHQPLCIFVLLEPPPYLGEGGVFFATIKGKEGKISQLYLGKVESLSFTKHTHPHHTHTHTHTHTPQSPTYPHSTHTETLEKGCNNFIENVTFVNFFHKGHVFCTRMKYDGNSPGKHLMARQIETLLWCNTCHWWRIISKNWNKHKNKTN